MRFSTDILSVLTCLVLVKVADGYTCYGCAYSITTEGNRRECIEDPDALGSHGHLDCNSTSYCVLQEQYDIHKDTVTSYFRTCSGVSWGVNSCDRDWSHVTCKQTCQGDFCNNGDRGERYKEYLAQHPDTEYNSVVHTKASTLFVTSCLMLIGAFTMD